MTASEQAIQDVLDDRTTSDWLKYALSAARERDCVDAARDAHLLAALLNARRKPALMRCDCGQEIELHNSWAEECEKCGAEYNGSGQRLASREQWGEETGETFASRNWSNSEEGA